MSSRRSLVGSKAAAGTLSLSRSTPAGCPAAGRRVGQAGDSSQFLFLGQRETVPTSAAVIV